MSQKNLIFSLTSLFPYAFLFLCIWYNYCSYLLATILLVFLLFSILCCFFLITSHFFFLWFVHIYVLYWMPANNFLMLPALFFFVLFPSSDTSYLFRSICTSRLNLTPYSPGTFAFVYKELCSSSLSVVHTKFLIMKSLLQAFVYFCQNYSDCLTFISTVLLYWLWYLCH